MARQIAIYKVLENRRRSLGRPVRRESVSFQTMDGMEIMTLVYSSRYTEETLSPWRVYRVCLFTLDHGVISDTILKQVHSK